MSDNDVRTIKQGNTTTRAFMGFKNSKTLYQN